jgi:hypothetical protein
MAVSAALLTAAACPARARRPDLGLDEEADQPRPGLHRALDGLNERSDPGALLARSALRSTRSSTGWPGASPAPTGRAAAQGLQDAQKAAAALPRIPGRSG